MVWTRGTQIVSVIALLPLLLLCQEREQKEVAKGATSFASDRPEHSLFDGKTTDGWIVDGDAKVVNGILELGGERTTSAQTKATFGSFELEFQYTGKEAKMPPEAEPSSVALKQSGMRTTSEIKVILNGLAYDLIIANDILDIETSNGMRHVMRRKPWIQSKWKVESDANSHKLTTTFKIELETSSSFALQPRDTVANPGSSQTSIGFRIPAGNKLQVRDLRVRPGENQPSK